MTTVETWELLRTLDDPMAVEHPVEFDRAAVARRFDALVFQLNKSFGCDCSVDAFPSVQDASFYGDVVVPAEATESGGQIRIRVSNFGRLAVYDLDGLLTHSQLDLDVLLDSSDRERVEDALSETGHITVSAEQLETKYDGPCTFWQTNFPTSSPTWWIRFFDYI